MTNMSDEAHESGALETAAALSANAGRRASRQADGAMGTPSTSFCTPEITTCSFAFRPPKHGVVVLDDLPERHGR